MVVTLLFKFVSQVTVPFAATERTACPGGQVPVMRSCLLLTDVAVALKFWFTSAAVAGVPGTKVLGIVKSTDHASGDASAKASVRLAFAMCCVMVRSAFMFPPCSQIK